MFSRVIAFFVCLIAVLLPFRLRILFAEFVGWVVQLFYGTYYGIINFILKELKKAEEEGKHGGE
ncbi:MAG: hypothetical protein CME60_04010 [Halobacteriovoraceae bacterium]|nr:hypothetical protein [Halobacteriovoraceae bacterium]|tara:strand:+ start:682 stop:873 length:192 start_codon:yes stop_codon:yes gene_type:complete